MKALLFIIVCIGVVYGQVPDPTCITMRLQQDNTLTECNTAFAANPADVCSLPCVQAFADLYTDCGITPNPITQVCPDLNGGSNGGDGGNGGTDGGNMPDPTCLPTRLQQDNTLTECSTAFAANPANLCSLSCAQALADVYTDCGFTPNPITQACPDLNSGGSNGDATTETAGITTTDGAPATIAMPAAIIAGILAALSALF